MSPTVVLINLSQAIVTAADQDYSGSALTPAVTVTLNGSIVPSAGYDVAYANNTNAGQATVTVTGKGAYTGTASGTFTIRRVASSLVSAPTARTLSYNGSSQSLVTAGSASGGTVYYLKTTSNSRPTSTSSFSSSIPSSSAVGTSYVWYYVKGDANHTDTAISSSAITVTIGRGTGSLSFVASSMAVPRATGVLGIAVTAIASNWEKTTAKSVTGMNVYRSVTNKGKDSSSAVMKLQFVNTTGAAVNTTIKVGPATESIYDYVYIAPWNASDIAPTSSSGAPSNAIYNGSGKTAEWTDVDITIPTGTNTLQVVYRKDGSVSISPDCGYVALPYDINFQSVQNVLQKSGDGTVTYTSNNTSVATVNSSTGLVTVVGTGTATITASMAATSNYTAASASYTVTVSNSTSCTEALTVSITRSSGSASLSAARVALKTGSTTLATLSTSSTTAKVAFGLNYTLESNDISGFDPPATVTKNWADTTAKSVTMQYTYLTYKIVVCDGKTVVCDGKTVIVNI